MLDDLGALSFDSTDAEFIADVIADGFYDGVILKSHGHC